MKIGDLVRLDFSAAPLDNSPGKVGIIVDVFQKKCWRTNLYGKKVNWDDIGPEPHASVMFSDTGKTLDIPVEDLELVNESR